MDKLQFLVLIFVVLFSKLCNVSLGNYKIYLSSFSILTIAAVNKNTHTHTHTQPFNGLLSGSTRVGQYQKKHSPTHTHPDHWTSFITLLHLQQSMAVNKKIAEN